MSPRRKSAVVLAAVFLLGALTGGGLATAGWSKRMRDQYAAPGPLRPRVVLRGLEREIDLDEGQRRRIEEILASGDGEARAIRREVRPRIAALRVRLLDDIRGVMRPDQMDGFQRFAARVEARAKAQQPQN